MSGDSFSWKVQVGKETTPGTAVAADTLILGAERTAIEPDRIPTFPSDSLGLRAESMRQEFGNYLVKKPLRVPLGYFQLLPILFSAGIKGGVTPVEQTTDQDDYLWNHAPSLTASNALNAFTIEEGDNAQAYEAEYVVFPRIRIAGEVNQSGEMSPVSVEADWIGRQWTKTTFTAAIAPPTVESMNAGLARLYFDATWANRGTTEKTNFLRGFDIEIITGVYPAFWGSAYRYFDAHNQGVISVMATLTLEGGANMVTQFDNFNAATLQAMQLKILGSQIGTGELHTLKLSIWGGWEYVKPINSVDRGNHLAVALFHSLYDKTGAQIFEPQVITNVSAI